MRRNRKLAVLGVVLIPLLAGGFLVQTRMNREGSVLLEQVLSLVSERFVDTLPQGAMYEKAARGLVRELNDPYTELLSPKELKQFSTRTGGKYAGLGMSIESRDHQIVVASVFPHTPAERGGVREGDRIVQVDTMSARGWTTQQAQDALLGTPGTKVRVKFARPGSLSQLKASSRGRSSTCRQCPTRSRSAPSGMSNCSRSTNTPRRSSTMPFAV